MSNYSQLIKRVCVQDYEMKNISPWINQKFLFHKMWGIAPCVFNRNKELRDELRDKYTQMESMAADTLKASFVYGFFQANSTKNGIKIYLEDYDTKHNILPSIMVSRQAFIETGKLNGRLVSKAILSEKQGEKDLIAFQVVTLGQSAVDKAKELKDIGEYQDYFYWHGYCAAATEALAARVHAMIRVYLGENEEQSLSRELYHQEDIGKRLSFGYEALPNLCHQNVVLDILCAKEIGVSMVENYGMLEPEYSTCAMILLKKMMTSKLQ